MNMQNRLLGVAALVRWRRRAPRKRRRPSAGPVTVETGGGGPGATFYDKEIARLDLELALFLAPRIERLQAIHQMLQSHPAGLTRAGWGQRLHDLARALRAYAASDGADIEAAALAMRYLEEHFRDLRI